MLSRVDAEHLGGLREKTLDVLRGTVGAGSDVALLDVSNHGNAGDSLIFAGEIAYLRQLGVRLRYASDMRSYGARDLRREMPRGVVLNG